MSQYARIRHDTTRPAWYYMSRTNPANPKRVNLPMAPETARYGGDTGQVSLKRPFVNWISSLNTAAAFDRMTRMANGWVNKSPWPAVQQVGFGGNVVRILKVVGGKAYIDYLPYTKPAPLYKNYENDPAIVHIFTVIDRDGNISLPTNKYEALQCSLCIVARKPVWMPVEDLEMFPPAPTFVRPAWPLTVRGVPVISAETSVGVILPKDVVTVMEYQPRGSAVWGRIRFNEMDAWIALYHPSTGYNTDWQMTTTPPPTL